MANVGYKLLHVRDYPGLVYSEPSQVLPACVVSLFALNVFGIMHRNYLSIVFRSPPRHS